MEQNSVNTCFSNNFRQIFAALSASLILISDGMHYGWTAPIIPKLQSTNSTITITQSDVSWLESSFLLAGMLFFPFTIMLVDFFGRRRTIILASILQLISWTLLLIADRILLLYIARVIAGIANDLCYVVVPIYIAETSNERIRGVLSSSVLISLLVGVLLIYSVVPFTAFYVHVIIGLVLGCVQLCSFFFMPESPYFLVMKNREIEAKRALNFLRPGQDIIVELTAIQRGIEEQRQTKNKIRDLFSKRHILKCLLIMSVLVAAQHLGGFIVILMNIHMILSSSGSIYFGSSTTAIIFSVLMLISIGIASCFVDSFGRKPFLIISQIGTACCLLTLAIYFHLSYLQYNLEKFSWIPVLSVAFYAISFKTGLGLIPIILMAEIFPTNVKSIGMTLGDFMYSFFAFISIEFYSRISVIFGTHVVFYFFAVFTIIVVVVTLLIIPETKGKSLEEIQMILKNKTRKQNTNTTLLA